MFKKINRSNCVVLAQNKEEFNTFCRNMLEIYEEGCSYFEGFDFIYYNGLNSIRGMKYDSVIKYGKWELRNDIDFEKLSLGISGKNGSFENSCRPYNDKDSIRKKFLDYKEIPNE